MKYRCNHCEKEANLFKGHYDGPVPCTYCDQGIFVEVDSDGWMKLDIENLPPDLFSPKAKYIVMCERMPGDFVEIVYSGAGVVPHEIIQLLYSGAKYRYRRRTTEAKTPTREETVEDAKQRIISAAGKITTAYICAMAEAFEKVAAALPDTES